jgi:hypothetical protein
LFFPFRMLLHLWKSSCAHCGISFPHYSTNRDRVSKAPCQVDDGITRLHVLDWAMRAWHCVGTGGRLSSGTNWANTKKFEDIS